MKKERYINIIFFCIIFIILLLITLSKPLNDLDELWNYNIARNMADGLVPYKDISMITSPLLSMITALFLKIISNELIITRILSATLATLILYSLYKTMSILKFNKALIYTVILILFFIAKDYFCLDYNWAVIFIGLIILNLELKNLEKDNSIDFKYELLIGILAGIAICFKQSVGIFISIASILSNVIFFKEKQDVKKILKQTIIRIIGIAIPIMILFTYLLINDAFYSFIDYCVLGIKTFDNKISYKGLLDDKNLFIRISAIVIPIIYLITIIYIIYNIIKNKNVKELFIMLIYSISMFTITFPISNDIHFLIGAFSSYSILAFYVQKISNYYIKRDINEVQTIIKILIASSVFVLFIYSVRMYISTVKEIGISTEFKHFKYIPITENLSNQIKAIDSYLLKCDDKIYILDSNAVVYMIPIDRYNKDYDMFNIGNFGSRGQYGKIEDLKKEDNVTILIKNDNYTRNWQTPELVRDYVINNLNKTGEILFYDIYKKNI